MRRTVYEVNYEKLLPLIKGMDFEDNCHKRLKSSGFMDLVVERLGTRDINKKEAEIYSLSHYYEQNGDLMVDPDMEIAVYHDIKMAEALTYQQDNLGIYQVVYPESGKFISKYKTELNRFLGQWLTNIKNQRYVESEE